VRFFNFAEVVEPGKEDVGLKGPIQLPKTCTAGAMSTAIFYGTSKRRTLVLKKLHRLVKPGRCFIFLLTKRYTDPAVYRILREAGTCAFICLLSY